MILWHQDTDLQGVDAVIVPGGFSYGDYLRVGAIARFAPIMGEVERFARHGGLVLGICNGFQVLCEAGLLPGALLPNTSLRFVCRQVELEVVNASIPWTRACERGERLSIPAKHTTGRYYAPDPVLDELEANDQVVLRYAPGENFNGSARDIAGVCNAAGNVLGLMPHPEHAVDVLTGLGRRAEADRRGGMTVMARHRELGLTDHEYELIVEKLEREPNEVELAVFSLMWSEHCGYKHSRRLLKTLPTEGPKLILGPGENAGAVAVGGGLVARVQGRVPQPPERGRAVPGRRDRRRRDPARRVRDRRAADRDPRLAALRRGRLLRPLALPARARGRRHRPLRQLDRRRDGRRRALLRGPLRAELPRQRDVRRADRGRTS